MKLDTKSYEESCWNPKEDVHTKSSITLPHIWFDLRKILFFSLSNLPKKNINFSINTDSGNYIHKTEKT